MATKWTMVRVSESTRKRLEAMRDSLLSAYEKGQIDLDLDERDRVSLNQVLSILLDREESHRKRSNRSATQRP